MIPLSLVLSLPSPRPMHTSGSLQVSSTERSSLIFWCRVKFCSPPFRGHRLPACCLRDLGAGQKRTLSGNLILETSVPNFISPSIPHTTGLRVPLADILCSLPRPLASAVWVSFRVWTDTWGLGHVFSGVKTVAFTGTCCPEVTAFSWGLSMRGFLASPLSLSPASEVV